MCGINGIIQPGGTDHFGQQVERMNRALAHRGPDDQGVLAEGGIALGHRRLSIIDLSAAGHQPMGYDSGRYSIVYNGELYNFRELKQELGDAAFRTSTDTEVILAAYAKWGTECLARFNGMFAFAIWDKTDHTLFIARDRLGIKPLYYTKSGGKIVFSSEIRGLLASGFAEKKLDRKALGDYLRYQTVHAPDTILEGVKMLLPGHYMLVTASAQEIKCWWKPVLREAAPVNYKTVCGDVRALLRDAVERRLVADVPFGAFLSGGIDSSAIVGLMSEVASSPVNTFSVTFDDSEFSEAVYAKLIAKKFNTVHHEIRLEPGDFLDDLPAALDAMDHPSGDGPNTYVVSKATKKAGITMALSGLGGDELFAGYDIFKRTAALERKKWLNAFPRGMRKAGGAFVKKLKPGVASEKMAAVLAQEKIGFRSFYPLSRQVLLDEQIDRLTAGRVDDPYRVQEIVEAIERDFPGEDFLLSRVSMAEISTYMQNVLLRDTDQMSMAHALEVRVPFLDYTLVEYVLNLPGTMKFPHTPKKLLVDSLGGLLPAEIVNRPKMGFTFPWKKWIKTELRGFCEERLARLGRREPFDAQGVTLLWRAFLQNDPRVTWSRIWPLVVLSHWLDKNDIA